MWERLERILGLECRSISARCSWRTPIQLRVYHQSRLVLARIMVSPANRQNFTPVQPPCRTQANRSSPGIDPEDFRRPGFRPSCSPVWTCSSEGRGEEMFRTLLGRGDRLYCGGVICEPEL